MHTSQFNKSVSSPTFIRSLKVYRIYCLFIGCSLFDNPDDSSGMFHGKPVFTYFHFKAKRKGIRFGKNETPIRLFLILMPKECLGQKLNSDSQILCN